MVKRTIEKGNKPVERLIPGLNKKEVTFKTGNVENVKVGVNKDVFAEAGSLPEDSQLPADNQFKPTRLVINLKLSSQEKQSFYFIDLQIRYDQDDEKDAGGREKLKLAYLAGPKWTVLTGITWGSDYFVSVTIPDFPDDPPIAIGH
jgi:hypothetical protein